MRSRDGWIPSHPSKLQVAVTGSPAAPCHGAMVEVLLRSTRTSLPAGVKPASLASSWQLTRNSLALQSDILTLRAGALGCSFRTLFPGPVKRWHLHPSLLQQPLLGMQCSIRQPLEGSSMKSQHRSIPRSRPSYEITTYTLNTLGGILTRQWQGLQLMGKATARTRGQSMSRHRILLQCRAAMWDYQRNVLVFSFKTTQCTARGRV